MEYKNVLKEKMLKIKYTVNSSYGNENIAYLYKDELVPMYNKYRELKKVYNELYNFNLN